MSWAALANKPKPVETPEQTAARLEQEAQRKAAEAAKALNDRAVKLCAAVEEAIKGASGGGVSGNYSAYQLSVKGEWTTDEITLAYDKWKAIYQKAGTLQSLNVHMMGPAQKWTGDRNGRWQANFIRRLQAGKDWMVNVHIDNKR